MEHWKKKLGAICLMLFLLVPGTATAVVIPKDLPTIEALIALHKCIKKDEDQALAEWPPVSGSSQWSPKAPTSSTKCGPR